MVNQKPPVKPPIKGAPKAQKTVSRNLSGAKGNNLRFVASRRKDGTISTFATYYVRDEKGKVVKSTHGASATHSSFEAAKAWIEQGVAKAMKEGGWKLRRGGGGGGRTATDAFSLDSLPKANA